MSEVPWTLIRACIIILTTVMWTHITVNGVTTPEPDMEQSRVSPGDTTTDTDTVTKYITATLASLYSDSTDASNDTVDDDVNVNDNNVTITSNKTKEAAPCHIFDEWGSPTFFVKYTLDFVLDLMCDCDNICLKGQPTMSPEERLHIWSETHWILSDRNRAKFITVTTVISAVLVAGLLGNLLTIICLTCWQKKKASTFLFILSLACSDFILLGICLPVKFMEVFQIGDNVLVGPLCTIVYFIRDFSLACSVLTLTVISFERFYAICYPLKAQYRCSTRRARILIVLIWIFSAICSIPTTLAWKNVSSDFIATDYVCTTMADDYRWIQAYHIYELTLLYILPLFVMGYTYTQCCLALYRSAKSAKNMQGDGDSKTETEKVSVTEKSSSTSATTTKGTEKTADDKGEGSIRARIKVMQMLIGMLMTFIVCWGPMLFYQIFRSFNIKPIPLYEDIVRLTVELLAFSNSTFNPYFYMGMSSQFRREFRNRLGWLCGLKSATPAESTVVTSSTLSTRYQSSVYSTQASGQPRI